VRVICVGTAKCRGRNDANASPVAVANIGSTGLLESVLVISTVSGRSLVTAAAMFSQAGMKWPSSDYYLGSVCPELSRRITAALSS
jgi:hypothetical protein